jgi:hypothetical protein
MSAPTVAFVAPDQPITRQLSVGVTGKPSPRLFTSPAGVVYELVWVTPEMADAWLDANTNNRNLRREVVDKLARDMTAGRFAENGDAVRFAANGELADGQHRLHAIVESQVGAWLLVVSNLPDAARDTVDDGVKRTLSDRMTFRGEACASTLAAVIRRAILWEHNHKYQTGGFQPSALESFEFLHAHPELREAAAAADHHRRFKLLPPSLIGLCWWLFAAIDQGACAEFFDRLGDGAMLPTKHPILTLRNRLTEMNARPGRSPERHSLAFVIKAWNYYRDGKELAILRHAEHEKFPQPK